jgi:hypothetical protein
MIQADFLNQISSRKFRSPDRNYPEYLHFGLNENFKFYNYKEVVLCSRFHSVQTTCGVESVVAVLRMFSFF